MPPEQQPTGPHRHAGGLDVHLVESGESRRTPSLGLPKAPLISAQRRLGSWLVLLFGLPMLLTVLHLWHSHLKVDTILLLTLTLTVVISTLGGIRPGLVAAVVGATAVNWMFVPPIGTLDIHDQADTVSLAVFVAVAVIVSALVDRVSRTAAEASRARENAEALARTATLLATSADPLPDLIEEACGALHLDSAALFERSATGGWTRVGAAGRLPPTRVSDGFAHPVDDAARRVLVLHGRSLNSNDAALLDGITDQMVVALDSVTLRKEAAEAEILGRANELRISILQAVSHDLRTPLTGIKASVSSLLSPDVHFSAEDTTALLSTIDNEVDRLDRVVGNLLDMSRLQSGVLPLNMEPTPVDEIVSSAIRSLGVPSERCTVSIPATVPPVIVDGVLIERALANVVANADAVQPASRPITIAATVDEDTHRVELSIADNGPGIPTGQRHLSLEPFQRLGDSSTQAGVGLGLAIANGLATANGGELRLSETPGGGLTATFVLPMTDGTDTTEHK